MGELKNIVFNPATGLFEDSTNPTAHLTRAEIRRLRRQSDPMAAQMKPIIRSITYTGGKRPLEGTTFEMSWVVERAQRVDIRFPSGNVVDFPPACSCQFVVPAQDCHVRLVAHNGKYTTQRTLQIHPRRLTLITKLLNKLSHQ